MSSPVSVRALDGLKYSVGRAGMGRLFRLSLEALLIHPAKKTAARIRKRNRTREFGRLGIYMSGTGANGVYTID